MPPLQTDFPVSSSKSTKTLQSFDYITCVSVNIPVFCHVVHFFFFLNISVVSERLSQLILSRGLFFDMPMHSGDGCLSIRLAPDFASSINLLRTLVCIFASR